MDFRIIEDKYLAVGDEVWAIKKINAIYIGKSEKSKIGEYAIFILYKDVTFELYYTSLSEAEITKQFKLLIKEIMLTHSNFRKSATDLLLNYQNIMALEYNKGIINNKVAILFSDAKLLHKGGAYLYNNIQVSLNDYKKQKDSLTV